MPKKKVKKNNRKRNKGKKYQKKTDTSSNKSKSDPQPQKPSTSNISIIEKNSNKDLEKKKNDEINVDDLKIDSETPNSRLLSSSPNPTSPMSFPTHSDRSSNEKENHENKYSYHNHDTDEDLFDNISDKNSYKNIDDDDISIHDILNDADLKSDSDISTHNQLTCAQKIDDPKQQNNHEISDQKISDEKNESIDDENDIRDDQSEIIVFSDEENNISCSNEKKNEFVHLCMKDVVNQIILDVLKKSNEKIINNRNKERLKDIIQGNKIDYSIMEYNLSYKLNELKLRMEKREKDLLKLEETIQNGMNTIKSLQF